MDSERYPGGAGTPRCVASSHWNSEMQVDSIAEQTHELAWAAGFFDGEGCTSVNHHLRNGSVNPFDSAPHLTLPRSPPDLRFIAQHHDKKAHGVAVLRSFSAPDQISASHPGPGSSRMTGNRSNEKPSVQLLVSTVRTYSRRCVSNQAWTMDVTC